MAFIRGRRRLCRERIFEGSSPSPEFIHDEISVNPPAIEPPVAKYIEKDLQKIIKTVLEVRAPSYGVCEKPLKARLSDVYRGKSHM